MNGRHSSIAVEHNAQIATARNQPKPHSQNINTRYITSKLQLNSESTRSRYNGQNHHFESRYQNSPTSYTRAHPDPIHCAN